MFIGMLRAFVSLTLATRFHFFRHGNNVGLNGSNNIFVLLLRNSRSPFLFLSLFTSLGAYDTSKRYLICERLLKVRNKIHCRL